VQDGFSRNLNYLRLSITDRCNLRCFYCTPPEGFVKLPAPEILRYEEFLRLAGVAAAAGIRKIRVTGGEPLLRRDVVDFLAGLKRVPGLQEVCLTTNGVRLADMARALYDTGLRHLNLSLDTLQRERYRELTGSDNLPEVLAGLERARDLGFQPLKINCVVLKGLNDDEVLDFARLAQKYPFQVRFIEFMPTVPGERWAKHFLPMTEVRRRLAPLGPLEPVAGTETAGPARIFRLPGFLGQVGFISPVSQHQCSSCNRLRLTASGGLRPCLFAETEVDLKGPLRRGESDAFLRQLFNQAAGLKDRGPRLQAPGALPLCRPMVTIGG
jgi:cyclic pyranopterin phosphate synthase